jgi:phage tail sheath protein FI
LEYNPSQGDRDLMYDTNGTGNALNPIINHPVHGIVIWGQRTTQRTASALDRVNVRRLLLRVRKLASVAASQVTFSPGDLATALSFENRLSPALEDLRQSRGLVDFRIQADETLNTPEVLARNELRARLFVKPTRAVEFFLMTVVLTEQGADFNDLAL